MQRYMIFLEPPKILGKICTYDPLYSKRARITANPVCYITNQITKNSNYANMNK